MFVLFEITQKKMIFRKSFILITKEDRKEVIKMKVKVCENNKAKIGAALASVQYGIIKI